MLEEGFVEFGDDGSIIPGQKIQKDQEEHDWIDSNLSYFV